MRSHVLWAIAILAACDDGGHAAKPDAALAGDAVIDADAAPPDAMPADAAPPDAMPDAAPTAPREVLVGVDDIPQSMLGLVPGVVDGVAHEFHWALPPTGWTIEVTFPAHWDPKLRIPRGQVVAAASIVSPKY